MSLDASSAPGDPDRGPEATAVAVVERLADGTFDTIRHRFRAESFDGPPPTELPGAWEAITGMFGEFQSVRGVDWDPETRTATVRFRLASSAAVCEATFDEAGLVTGLEIRTADGGPVDRARRALHAGRFAVVRGIDAGLRSIRTRLPVWGPPGPTDREGRVETARQVMELLADGEFRAVTELFDPEFREALPPEQLEVGWERCGGEFDGFEEVEYDPEEGVVYGRFDPGHPVQVEVHFDGAGRIRGLLFSNPDAGRTTDYEPPDYADPPAFVERSVTVGEDGDLDGTLAVPRGIGPFPAVVVVHGSGMSDRDGSSGSRKPYRDLAHGFATGGIATLRYDKRSLSDGSGAPEPRVVGDAVTAVERLRDEPAVDDGAVVVLGHSLGGFLAPRIAAEAGANGVVALAAPSDEFLDLAVEQVRFLRDRDASAVETTVEEARAAMERVRDGAVPDGERVLGYPAAFWDGLQDVTPVATLAENGLPALVCHGGEDWRIPEEQYDGWATADAPVERRRYPDLNHLFVPGEADDLLDREHAVGHVDRRVVEDVAGWIRKRVRPDGSPAGEEPTRQADPSAQ